MDTQDPAEELEIFNSAAAMGNIFQSREFYEGIAGYWLEAIY